MTVAVVIEPVLLEIHPLDHVEHAVGDLLSRPALGPRSKCFANAFRVILEDLVNVLADEVVEWIPCRTVRGCGV